MSAADNHPIFVTGVTGYLGAAVLDRMLADGARRVHCLVREPDRWTAKAKQHPEVSVIRGDLAVPGEYLDAAGSAGTILHMAAATGNAPEHDMRSINVDATRRLTEAAVSGSARRFVFMSSIAARGARIDNYPYALSKREAETIVRQAGIDATILRPTIVLGSGATNWIALRKLACLPIVPLFGGGRANIQPIDVRDVSRVVARIILHELPCPAELDIGGPQVLTFSEFLRRVRAACGKPGLPGLTVPYPVARALLNIANKLTGQRMPLSSAQLSPFVNDGTAAPSPMLDALKPEMTPLDELLSRIAGDP